MNKKILFSAVMATLVAAAGSAVAQGYGNRDHNNQAQHSDRHDRGQQRGNQDNRWRANRDVAQAGRGAGPNHQFYRGGRLPTEYHNRQYVVDDWRGHRLSAPPRGYHWVQTGGDYVLVAIATGVILQLLLNN